MQRTTLIRTEGGIDDGFETEDGFQTEDGSGEVGFNMEGVVVSAILIRSL